MTTSSGALEMKKLCSFFYAGPKMLGLYFFAISEIGSALGATVTGLCRFIHIWALEFSIWPTCCLFVYGAAYLLLACIWSARIWIFMGN